MVPTWLDPFPEARDCDVTSTRPRSKGCDSKRSTGLRRKIAFILLGMYYKWYQIKTRDRQPTVNTQAPRPRSHLISCFILGLLEGSLQFLRSPDVSLSSIRNLLSWSIQVTRQSWKWTWLVFFRKLKSKIQYFIATVRTIVALFQRLLPKSNICGAELLSIRIDFYQLTSVHHFSNNKLLPQNQSPFSFQ